MGLKSCRFVSEIRVVCLYSRVCLCLYSYFTAMTLVPLLPRAARDGCLLRLGASVALRPSYARPTQASREGPSYPIPSHVLPALPPPNNETKTGGGLHVPRVRHRLVRRVHGILQYRLRRLRRTVRHHRIRRERGHLSSGEQAFSLCFLVLLPCCLLCLVGGCVSRKMQPQGYTDNSS